VYSRAALFILPVNRIPAVPEKLCTIQSRSNGIAIVAIPGSSDASARELLEAIRRQTSALAGKDDINGFIFTSSEGDFCRCLIESSSSVHDAGELSSFGQQVAFSLEKTGKPCIVAVDGECSGLGLEIALACDFIVASQPASFGFTGIAAGLIPFCGGSQRLARLIGKSKTKELIYSGDLIDAAEAHRIGLINRLYSEGDALTEAVKLLEHICTRSPNAIRIGGEIVNAGYDIDLQTACMLERNAFALCFASFDQREGMQAFLDKRTPQFKGE
jgi:enoyl-CoA hydratase